MTTIDDERLTTLASALAPEAFGHILSASGLQQEDSVASNSHVELVKHAPGRRATLLYSFGGQTKAPKCIIGKLYRGGRRPARIHGWLSALNSDVFPQTGRIRVPHPLGLSAELHMLLYAYIDGVDLRHALDEDEALMLAARWLAGLHDARPLAGLKFRTIEHEAAKSLRSLETVRTHVSPGISSQLGGARERLSQVLAAPPVVELRTIHRDYYYANLLWDGERIWAIDMDELRIGDPALDVAHFLTHLQVLAYRQTGDFAAYKAQGGQFRTSYFEALPTAEVDARLPIYGASTFLKLAATEVERQRDGWREATEAFAARACAELEKLR